MVFSNSVFVFAFLPVTLLVYYLLKRFRELQNVWLVIVSLCFYAWGEPKIVLVMLASILINYGLGLWAYERRKNEKSGFPVLCPMVIYNLGVLFIFKYLTFVSGLMGITSIKIALPIGISFYTFQSMSYVIDVWRGNGEVQKNPLNVALYVAFFPQLIAGPIVRYQTIAEQIRDRKETAELFNEGVRRFLIGLGKKVLLANAFSVTADYCFGHTAELSVLSAWIGALTYTLQIYYDFSGYSDMAIGLGKMFGFRFEENFRYPYISADVSDFWRRWHISLGTWFRDYVYFPLGGSRVGRGRLIWNLLVVWTLTGIWHGANWTFLFWGLGYFVILTMEKLTGLPEIMRKHKLGFLYRIFTMLCIMGGWVMFRADSVGEAFRYLRTMCGFAAAGADSMSSFLLIDLKLLLAAGILGATPLPRKLGEMLKDHTAGELVLSAAALVLFLFCIGSMVNSSYNPFIYFNF